MRTIHKHKQIYIYISYVHIYVFTYIYIYIITHMQTGRQKGFRHMFIAGQTPSAGCSISHGLASRCVVSVSGFACGVGSN